MVKVIGADQVSISFEKEITETLEKATSRPVLRAFITAKQTTETPEKQESRFDPFALNYAKWTEKACNRVGVIFQLEKVWDRGLLEDAIEAANEDPTVHGILVYYPVFGGDGRQDQYLQSVVSPHKDVEGLCHLHRSNMYRNIRSFTSADGTMSIKAILPCTPLAVIKILEHIGVYSDFLRKRLHGRTITIINRSEIVGRPLAALLANDGALVYSVDLFGIQKFEPCKASHFDPHTANQNFTPNHHHHHKVLDCEETFNLEKALSLSNIVISAVPSSDFRIDPLQQCRKDGPLILINVASHPNFTLAHNDFSKEDITFVPSVGKVTIAMLLRNLIRLYHQ